MDFIKSLGLIVILLHVFKLSNSSRILKNCRITSCRQNYSWLTKEVVSKRTSIPNFMMRSCNDVKCINRNQRINNALSKLNRNMKQIRSKQFNLVRNVINKVRAKLVYNQNQEINHHRSLGSLTDSLLDKFSNLVKKTASKAKNVASSVINTAKDDVHEVSDALKNVVSSINNLGHETVNEVKGRKRNLKNDLKGEKHNLGLLKTIMLRSIFGSLTNKVHNISSSILKTVKSKEEHVMESLKKHLHHNGKNNQSDMVLKPVN